MPLLARALHPIARQVVRGRQEAPEEAHQGAERALAGPRQCQSRRPRDSDIRRWQFAHHPRVHGGSVAIEGQGEGELVEGQRVVRPLGG
eukprot:13293320-Alexandrium_andersonii.AAC.1